jgi:hypothetical protein
VVVVVLVLVFVLVLVHVLVLVLVLVLDGLFISKSACKQCYVSIYICKLVGRLSVEHEKRLNLEHKPWKPCKPRRNYRNMKTAWKPF